MQWDGGSRIANLHLLEKKGSEKKKGKIVATALAQSTASALCSGEIVIHRYFDLGFCSISIISIDIYYNSVSYYHNPGQTVYNIVKAN